MAPLQVVQTLVGQSSGGGVATMGMVKPYLQETITRERKEISHNRHRIDTLRTDTEKRRAELSDLGTKPAVFQATRCSDCGQSLDLPAVHFLCKHSFHQRCLRSGATEGEAECPKCASENDVIRKMREGQREGAERHELFKGDLERSEDRFATIAEWFFSGSHGCWTEFGAEILTPRRWSVDGVWSDIRLKQFSFSGDPTIFSPCLKVSSPNF